MTTVPARRVAAAAVAVVFFGAGCAAVQREPSMAVIEAEQPTSETESDIERPPSAMPGEEAIVVHVVDGDTFDVELVDGTVERVRFPQIDTPEVDECGYAESAAVLEELILGETVRLVPTEYGPDRDSYGRLLRAVAAGCSRSRTRPRWWGRS